MKAISSIKEQLATLAVTTWITGWMAANPDKTRTRLAKALCAQLGLRDSKGAPRLATTAQALRDLEAEGCWTLPVAGRQGSGPRTPQRLGEAVPAPEGVPAQVEQMDGLVLVEVASGHQPVIQAIATVNAQAEFRNRSVPGTSTAQGHCYNATIHTNAVPGYDNPAEGGSDRNTKRDRNAKDNGD